MKYLFRRRRLAVPAVLIAIMGMGLAVAMPTASAFYIQNHESITRAALPADQVNERALQEILVGPPPGGGAVGSDAFVGEEFRHLDNAVNPVEICNRATQAWNVFWPVIASGSVLAGGGLVDGNAARAAFGGLLHTQQDFYAHSNYVEINLAEGQPDRLAAPIFPTCDPAAFPPALHTGYFNLDFGDHDDPLGGCPPAGPPPGFVDCHSTLAKDGTSSPNYPLATRASTDLFWLVRGMVAAQNGEEAAVQLFQAAGDPIVPPAAIAPALAEIATRGK